MTCHIWHKFREEGGGYFIKFLVAGFSMRKELTQLDRRSCENEGLKRFKINLKSGQLDLKIEEKIGTKCLKSVK